MNVTKISFGNSNISAPEKNKGKELVKTVGVLTATPAAFVGGYFIKDYFSGRKEYNNQVNNVHSSFEKKVQLRTAQRVQEAISRGETVTEGYKEAIRDGADRFLKREHLKEPLEKLKQARTADIRHGIRLSAGIGLAIAPILLIANYYMNKKKDTTSYAKGKDDLSVAALVKPASMQVVADSSKLSKKTDNVSFCGIVDELASELTYSEMQEYREYIKGNYPTDSEYAIARRVAKEKRETSGPNSWTQYAFSTDREYRMYLLRKEVGVPDKPPEYYRNYDKLFDTARYRAFLRWPEYTEKSLKYERLISIMDRVIQENIAKEKAELELKAKKQITLAYTKFLISKDFVIDFNSQSKDKQIPNAVLVEGKNPQERKETIQWIVGKINGNYVFVPDNNESNETRLNQVLSALESIQDRNATDDKPTLLWVENFDKLLVNTEDNEEIIGDLKDLLCKLSTEYNTTLIFDTQDSTKLAPIALQKHRVNFKINLDREVKQEEFNKLKEDYILAHISSIPYNGKRFKFVPGSEEYVDLYKGGCGYDDSILWIDSSDNEKIQVVIDNVDTIKKIPDFSMANIAEFPKPSNISTIKPYPSNSYHLTEDGQDIYYVSI